VERLRIEREQLVNSLSGMRDAGYSYLVKITAVDYEKLVEVIYIVRNLDTGNDEVFEVDLDPSDAWVPTVIGVYKAADWYERELYEMFGVEIKGRYADRLLLEKWNGKGAPLRKNFIWSAPYEKGA
jgi:NADH-quinone oxidoreductase subunit C